MQVKEYEKVLNILKLMSNSTRLKILCYLLEKNMSVSELLNKIEDVSQTSISQHLALLREANIVSYNREHNVLRYFILDKKIKAIIQVFYDNYCNK